MKTFAVIGLGRFGTSLALELSALGHEVLAVGSDPDTVQAIADRVTHAVTADARDIAVLKALGVQNYDCAVVAVAEDVGTSALITLNLKELGVQKVICKAQSHVHRRVLEKIGADRVVFPEHEMGTKLAQNLSSSNVLNFIEVFEGCGIVELAVPRSWIGKSLRDLDVQKKYRVNIIAVSKNGVQHVGADPNSPFGEGDQVMALGRSEDINRLHEVK